jgi:hypothetical protein
VSRQHNASSILAISALVSPLLLLLLLLVLVLLKT